MLDLLDYVLAWDANGKLARTQNFLKNTPIWEDISSVVEGKINDATLDWHSEYVTSEFEVGGLGAYVVTTDSMTLRIYYLKDIRASSLTAVLLQTYTMNDSSTQTSARIVASREQAGLVAVHWRDRTGCRYAESTNYGGAWGSVVMVGSANSDSTNDDAPLGFDIYDNYRFAVGVNGSDEYSLYYSTNGTSFAELSGSIASNKPLNQIVAVDENTLYYNAGENQSHDIDLNFSTGHTDYTFTHLGGSVISEDGRSVVQNPHLSIHNIPDNFVINDIELVYKYTLGESNPSGTLLPAGTSGICRVLLERDNKTIFNFVFTKRLENDVYSPYDYSSGWITASIQDFSGKLKSIESNSNIILDFYSAPTPFPDVFHLAQNNIFLDRITFIGHTSVFYRVDDYRSSAIHIALGLPDVYTVHHIQDLGNNRLSVIGKNDTGTYKHFISPNKGFDWQDKGVTSYKGLQQSDTNAIFFGEESIGLASDDGKAIQNKSGNIASVFGNTEILGVESSFALIAQIPSQHEGNGCASLSHGLNDQIVVTPLALRTAEKRETATDLSITTPAGMMPFTRHYRQYKQSDDHYQIMGRGWTHDHHIQLIEDTNGSPSTLRVYTPGAGEIYLEETATDHYEATAGSGASVDVDRLSSPATFTLITPDRSVFVFEQYASTSGVNKARLVSRTWANGEFWTYHYDGNDHLSAVVDAAYSIDGSNNKRQLSFTYFSGGAYDNLLYRVTDHTGRYVEFAYTDAYGTVDGHLLTGVTDVRGQPWTYTYFNAPGEHWNNWLKQIISPSVDQDGDGTADGTITIKDVEYTFEDDDITSIVQTLGKVGSDQELLQKTYHFQPGITEEVIDGKTTFHRFAGGVYTGPQDPGGNFSLTYHNKNYRPAGQWDANGNLTAMRWSEDGNRLEQVSDAQGHATHFVYNDNETLREVVDTENRKTSYIYNPAQRQPTMIVVALDDQTLQINGDMEMDSGWTDVGSPSTNAQSDEYAYTGVYSRYISTGSSGVGAQSQPFTLYAQHAYTLKAQVRVMGSGAVTMRLVDGTGTPLSGASTTSTTTNKWAGLSLNHLPTATVSNARIQFVADSGAAEFYVDAVQLRSDRELAFNGDMELTSGWTALGSATHSRSSAEVDTGDYAWSVDANLNDGIESVALDVVAGKSYVVMARVYPINTGDLVKMTTSNGDFTVLSDGNGAWKTLRAVFQVTEDDTLSLQFKAASSTAQFYVDSVHVVEVKDPLRWQEFIYDAKGRTVSEATLNVHDASFIQRTSRAYVSSNTPANGLLESVTQHSPDGQADDVSTDYTYDSLGRVVKTRKTSMFGTCEFSYTVYDAAGNVEATVCGLYNSTPPGSVAAAEALYDAGDALKKYSRVTTHEYDALGRRVQTHSNVGRTDEQTSLTLYDALGRIHRSIANYVAHTNPPGDWEWANDRWEDGSGNPIHTTEATENIISDTTYDNRGMVLEQRDALGRVSRQVYNDAGRLVRSVTNYVPHGATAPADWEWANDRWEDGSGNPINQGTDYTQNLITEHTYDPAGNTVQAISADRQVSVTTYDALNRPLLSLRNAHDPNYNFVEDPALASYPLSVAPDKDGLQKTVYDAMGRVLETHQLLDNRQGNLWTVTRQSYDALGRQYRSVRNFTASTDPATWQWQNNRWEDANGHPISHGIYNDENLITETAYDDQGRVLNPIDLAGRKTRYVYDGQGRRVKTVVNYTDMTDPANWLWTNDQWEKGTGSPVEFGTYNDMNLISETVYDSDGRVETSRDVLGRITRNVYDTAGRQVKTIRNYVSQGATDPFDWEWANDRWEDGSGNPIDHGTNNHDLNLISETIYDTLGRVQMTRDARGNQTYVVYDVLGRRVLSVNNYVPQGMTDPADWEWANDCWEDGSGSAINRGSNNDFNIISQTSYDRIGQVTSTRDAAGKVTRSVLDALGRRTMTITNFEGTDPDAWYWDTQENCWKDGSDQPVDHGTHFDHNLITTTGYDRAGRVATTRDVRGTLTTFTYDAMGRRLSTTRAADTSLAVTDYSCYDKAGRVLRTIRNWADLGTSPDAQTNGKWDFAPTDHGDQQAQNIITTFSLDLLGRQVAVTDPAGNTMTNHYAPDGQLVWRMDAEHTVSRTVYDATRRSRQVVQGYVDQRMQIVFASDRVDPGVRNALFGVDMLGNTTGPLTPSTMDARSPEFSSDGQKIVFQGLDLTTSATYHSIYTMNPDGSDITLVTTLDDVSYEPTWSPDKTQIAFIRWDNNHFVLMKMNSNGSNQQVVFAGDLTEEQVGLPHWSPDGSKILFELRYDDPVYTVHSSDLCTVNADGTDFKRLTDGAGTYRWGKWSPDGSAIVFYALISGKRHIYRMRADGSQITQLTNDADGQNFNAIWSPDGDQLAFYSRRDGNRELYLMNLDGSHQRRLAPHPDQDAQLTWSPIKTDPENWVWDSGDEQWELENGDPVTHGTNNDLNIVVQVSHDVAGRMTALRHPLGRLDAFRYDRLDRRTTHVRNYTDATDPADWVWTNNRWENGQGSPISMDADTQTPVDYDQNLITRMAHIQGSYTNKTFFTKTDGVEVERDFDRLGRLKAIMYGDPSNTPDVVFGYDGAGNRTLMSEYTGANFTSKSRETIWSYDDARRVTAVDFNENGTGPIENTVAYAYDVSGRRTQMTVNPGTEDLTLAYEYDIQGRLIGMTDWDGQYTCYAYDDAGRHIQTIRPNGVESNYSYDVAGRLRRLHHLAQTVTLADFRYEVDGRGNRIQAYEKLAQPATVGASYDKDATEVTYLSSSLWAEEGNFKKTTEFSGALAVEFTGSEVALTVGVGVNHSLFDIYIDGTLWDTYDGYADATGERVIRIAFEDGDHTLEVRNRAQHSLSARRDGAYADDTFIVRFKQLDVLDTTYDEQTILYTYDALSRLLSADYYAGQTTSGSPFREYAFDFDLAGNRLSESLTLNSGTLTVTNYDYNAVNQLVSNGTDDFSYDANGNLWKTNTLETHTWDHANRMLTAPGNTSYAYDGLGNRIQQSVSSVVTDYLLDLQAGLTKVIAETTGINTERYIHDPRGIFAHEDSAGVWKYILNDGLGSVRAEVASTGSVSAEQHYAPFGQPFATNGTFDGSFGFTGEQTDGNGQVYLRARYYNPSIGTFKNLDPFEGFMQRPISLNGYSWVEGSVVNKVDPSGKCWANPSTPIELKQQCREQWDNLFPRNIGRVGGSCDDIDLGILFNHMSMLSHEHFVSSIQSREFQDRIANIGIPVLDECGNVIIPCSQIPTNTLTPTPTPSNEAIYVYFGGSRAGNDGNVNVNLPTDETFARNQAPLLAGRADYVIPYPGVPQGENTSVGTIVGKQQHALDGIARTPSGANLYAYGYSAGADSALMFADQYQGNVVGLGIIGGTLDGGTDGYLAGPSLRTDENENNIPDWQDKINRLLNNGTRVVVVDDNIDGKPDWATFNGTANQSQNYCYLNRTTVAHYQNEGGTTATNRSSAIAQDVFNFMENGVCAQ